MFDMIDISNLGGNIYVVIGGGVLVLLVAWFMFRNGSKDKPEKGKKETTKKQKDKGTIQPGDASEKVESVEPNQPPKWKQKMNFLKSLRSRTKADTANTDGEEVLIPDIISDIEIPLQTEFPVRKEQVADIAVPAVDLPSNNHESFDTAVTMVGPEETGEIFQDTGTDISAEDELPPVEEIPEDTTEVYTYTEPEKEKSEDGDIFSLFTQDDMEDNEVSKFAATLNPVNINDLLSEVNTIKKYLRK